MVGAKLRIAMGKVEGWYWKHPELYAAELAVLKAYREQLKQRRRKAQPVTN